MSKINILIVEDDPIIGADLEDRLADMGYQTLGPFESGEAAFASLEHNAPDLILMDVNLAGVWDGIETARRIMAKKSLPIIYLTSNSDDATFNEAKKTQPAAFLSKPFRGRDLKHAIELAILKLGEDNQQSNTEIEQNQPVLMDDRLFIKHKNRLERIYFNDILWIEADDYYCRVYTIGHDFLMTQTLSKFSEKLNHRPDFFRPHRSFIVNLKHVEQISEAYLYIGNKQIPISQSSRSELMNRIKTG